MWPFSMHKPLDTASGDDVETVLARLTQTMAWCAPRAQLSDPRNCLRTPALRPHPLEGSRKQVVESVARSRHIALGCRPPAPATSLGGGRLLLYEPDINLAHGLEEGATSGYVDIDNI